MKKLIWTETAYVGNHEVLAGKKVRIVAIVRRAGSTGGWKSLWSDAAIGGVHAVSSHDRVSVELTIERPGELTSFLLFTVRPECLECFAQVRGSADAAASP
jgi:hypothetical protein